MLNFKSKHVNFKVMKIIYGLCKYSYIIGKLIMKLFQKKCQVGMIFSDKKYNRNEKLFRV